MNLLLIFFQLLLGALGGNIAGRLLKRLDLGLIGNSFAGAVGGGLGGQMLRMIGINLSSLSSSEFSFATILGLLASGCVGGAALMAAIGAIKKALVK